MKEQKTIYHLIVDESGSMADCIDNTITGFNEQVARIMQMEKEFPAQEITMGLTTFNDRVTHHYFQKNPAPINKITLSTYMPGGSTALLDGIGMAVNKIEQDAAISNLRIPTTVIVVIITDGHENASKEYSFKQIREMISRLEATEKWTFSFIGANIDTAEVAEQLSIKKNSISFNKDQMQDKVWDKLSDSMTLYLLKKESRKDTSNFFEE